MKYIITKKENITSKAGVQYVKLYTLSQKGETGEFFMTKEKYDIYGIDDSKVCSSYTLDKFFELSDQVDVDFDHRGFIYNIR